jgi:hypothetical protein
MRPLSHVAATLALSLLAAQPARAQWVVKSDFQLHLTENTFDKIIQDFWNSLQGTKTVAVGNVPVDLGDTKLQINGINVAVNYAFPIPTRTNTTHRIWELKSNNLSANVTVDQLVITRTQTSNIGGIDVGNTVTVVCNNIRMTLPAGKASIAATVEAQVAQNQVQLTMPTYTAQWPADAWQVSSINCPDLADVGDQVKAQIINYLSSFQNMDAAVTSALTTQFQTWSQQASLLLLSQQQLPTGNDYLKVFYQPSTARENNGDGLILGGILEFNYPYVAQGQMYEQDFSLPSNTQLVAQANPQLLVPFQAIKALMMGEYFAGQLAYAVHSSEIAGFQTLEGSFFKKLFGWPDLLSFPADTNFLFQALPMGPPSFTDEASAGTNAIKGNLAVPLSLRMFAPINNQYTPYVEFRTTVAGPAVLTLGASGKVNFQIAAQTQPTTYAFANDYVAAHNPNKHIAVDTIATTARTALNTDGMQLTIPTFTVGASLSLVPADWAMLSNDVLRLDFSANVANVVTASVVKKAAAPLKKATSVRSVR